MTSTRKSASKTQPASVEPTEPAAPPAGSPRDEADWLLTSDAPTPSEVAASTQAAGELSSPAAASIAGTAPQSVLDREQRVRNAAYAFYKARNGAPGLSLDDWLAAEAQVDAEMSAELELSPASKP